ncbi:hypothetical protein D3C87_1253470 [compost metagenome]
MLLTSSSAIAIRKFVYREAKRDFNHKGISDALLLGPAMLQMETAILLREILRVATVTVRTFHKEF